MCWGVIFCRESVSGSQVGKRFVFLCIFGSGLFTKIRITDLRGVVTVGFQNEVFFLFFGSLFQILEVDFVSLKRWRVGVFLGISFR